MNGSGHMQKTQEASMDETLKSAAFLSKTLSDSNLLRILLFISSGKKSVSSIVEELALSQPLVSHHLKELKRSLLVKVEREGPFIYYELSDGRILDIVQTLSEIAAKLGLSTRGSTFLISKLKREKKL